MTVSYNKYLIRAIGLGRPVFPFWILPKSRWRYWREYANQIFYMTSYIILRTKKKKKIMYKIAQITFNYVAI